MSGIERDIFVTAMKYANKDDTYSYVISEDGKPSRIDDDIRKVMVASGIRTYDIRNFDISHRLSVLVVSWVERGEIKTDIKKIKWI